MRIFLACLTVVSFSTTSMAATPATQGPGPNILVQAHQASPISFAALLRTEDHLVAFSRFQLENWHSPEELKRMKDLVASHLAQLGQVPGPLLTKKYSQLLSQAYAKNWPVGLRNQLAHLWLTTYTLETDPLLKSKLLADLVRFHPNYQPLPESFAPPVLDAWRSAVTPVGKLTWTPGSGWQGFQYLVINGTVIDLREQADLILPDQPVQLTAISDQYLAIDRIISGRDLLSWQPTREILLSGSCEQPVWSSRLPEGLQLQGYFHDDCIKPLMPKPSMDLAPNSKIQLPSSAVQDFGIPPSHSEQSGRPKWQWFVVGAIVAGIAGSQFLRAQPKSSPTQGTVHAAQAPVTHEGF